jgi:hypothetical protein
MTIPFKTSIDLDKNEVQNAVLQLLSSDPSSPVEGQMYYHSTNDVPMFYNGSAFVAQMSSGSQTFAGAKTFSTAITSPGHVATGQTGATTSTKYAGGTASGAPGSGTYSTGDWIVATGGDIWVCSAGGTPGTWVRVGSYLLGNSNTWTAAQTFNAAITGNNTINLTGTGASSVGGTFQATQHIATGQTGATTSTKYAGGTASGSPGSGTFTTGDWIVTTAGDIWICTSGGTPGTWSRVGSYLLGATNTWTAANTFNGAITGNNTINLTGTGTSSVGGQFTGTAVRASGLTGATQASGYVGATTSGAPASGTFAVGDFIIDRSGSIWICTSAGSPGTWAQLTSSSLTASATVAAETSYGLSSSAGAAGTYSRGDHTHGSPSLSSNAASAQTPGDSATNGSGTAPAKDDHKHSLPNWGNVTTQTTFGASSSNGSNTTFSRSDHQHGTPTHDGSAHSTIPLNSLATATADYSMGGFKLTNVGTPTASTDAATKGYVDGIAQGIDVHASVRAASTATVTVTYSSTGGTSGRGQITAAPNTLDGVSLASGNRILLKNQSTGAQNGIWVVTTLGSGANGVWDRATDFDQDAEVTAGAFVFVEEGTVNADSGWILTTDNPIVIGGASGTTLAWAQFSGAGQLTAGAGLTKSGNTLDVGQGTGITVNADDVAINTAVVVTKYAVDVGNGSNTSITVTHNLGTKDVIVEVFDNSTPFARIFCDVLHATTNTVTLGFSTAPTSAQYRCVVHA